MAMMISWVAPVNPSHPYLENDPAPSFDRTICAFHLGFSLGTFLRSFQWGHVRQLDRVSRELLARAWAAGAGPGPGDGPLTIDLDSTICETYGLAKEGGRHHGYTGARGYHPLLAVAAGTGDVLLARLREGRADTARGAAHFLRETVSRVRYDGARGQLTVRPTAASIPTPWSRLPPDGCLLLHHHPPARQPAEPDRGDTRRCLDSHSLLDGRRRRCRRDDLHSVPDRGERRAGTAHRPAGAAAPGSQLALFASYSYHGFITDRDGETLELEADHRRHAEIENAIRDLKYGVGLNHLPSGRFAANGAWLAVQAMAHNLARWTARIGLGEQIVTTKTLRRRFFALAGRLTRSARRLTLHLPQHWPWETQFSRALARLRAIPLPA